MSFLATLRLLWVMAFRNIFARWIRSLIVGIIIFWGTFIVVSGDALLDSVEESMSRSIVYSISGHLQLFSAEAKDPLTLFPSMSLFDQDYGIIDKYPDIKEVIAEHPNVKATLPMGFSWAILTFGNDLDKQMSDLRDAVRSGDEEAIRLNKAHVRQSVAMLQDNWTQAAEVAQDTEEIREGFRLLERATSESFWTEEFASDRLNALEFLENKIAPLSYDGKIRLFPYLGTDLDAFVEHFDRFRIVKGEMVPPGQRGFMFNTTFYEMHIKHPVARLLDEIKQEIELGEVTIADTATLQDKVKRTAKQYQRVTYQLNPKEAEELSAELRAFLRTEGDIGELLQELLTVNDENFQTRYDFFYNSVAPRINLYAVEVGDVFPIKTFTRSGFLNAVNLKVYGVFRFEGLGKDDGLSPGHNLMDLMSFRDLYGYLTEEKRQEIASIRDEYDLEGVDRDSAIDSLFGGDGPLVVEGTGVSAFDEFDGAEIATTDERQGDLLTRAYTKEEIQTGFFGHVTVMLKDPSKIWTTMEEIQALADGANLGLEVTDWQTSAGIVGQMVFVVRVILYVSIGIIFLVALVIINNLMIMATLERISEIGTFRAIGAGRLFVMSLFMLEIMMLGTMAGTLGAFAGAGAILILNRVGIPAQNDPMIFIFSGEYLYPEIALEHLLYGIVVVLIVSLLSTFIPSYMATRVQPIVAMQNDE